jgi:hypothetical protein
MNKINNFDGDNDHVDGEQDSASDKHSDEEEPEHEHELMLSGPVCNVLDTARSDTRLFSDLSSKVVNINSDGFNN